MGMGADGAAGARALSPKAIGSMVAGQTPQTVPHAGLPQALAPIVVDVAGDLIPVDPLQRDPPADPPAQMDDEQLLQTLFAQVRDRTGVDFSRYKTPTIWRRLQRRMVATRTHHLRNYIAYLEIHPDEY